MLSTIYFALQRSVTRAAIPLICGLLVFLGTARALCDEPKKEAPKKDPPAAAEKERVRQELRKVMAAATSQLKSGEFRQAKETVREAEAHFSDDSSVRLLASMYRVLGERSDALRLHEKNIEVHPKSAIALAGLADFYRRVGRDEEAQETLDRVLSVEVEDEQKARPFRQWARRLRAQSMAKSGRYGDLLAAVELLDENAEDGELPEDDQIAKARMLWEGPASTTRRRAIELYEQVAQRRFEELKVSDAPAAKKLGPSVARKNVSLLSKFDRMRVSQLYFRLGDWVSSRRVMESLLDDMSDDEKAKVKLVASYSIMLVSHDETKEALRQLDDLGEKHAGHRTVMMSRAIVLDKLGKADEAAEAIENWIDDRRPINSLEKVQDVAAAAEVLTEIGKIDEADEAYREYVKLAPGQLLRYAKFVGLHGDVDRAFELYEKTLTTGLADPPSVISAAVATLKYRADEVASRHFVLTSVWLTTALRNQPENLKLSMIKAQLLELREEFDAAADLLRDLLKRPGLRNPDSVQGATVRHGLAHFLGTKLDRAEEAMPLIELAIQTLGPRPNLLDTRAMVHLAAGRPKQAVTDLKLALSDYNPGERQLHFLRLAQAQLAVGARKQASDALHSALADGLNPKRLPKFDRKLYEELVEDLKFQGDARITSKKRKVK